MITHIPGLQERVFGPGNHSTLVTLFSMMIGCVLGWLLFIAALMIATEAHAAEPGNQRHDHHRRAHGNMQPATSQLSRW
jgi:hypothetical protein